MVVSDGPICDSGEFTQSEAFQVYSKCTQMKLSGLLVMRYVTLSVCLCSFGGVFRKLRIRHVVSWLKLLSGGEDNWIGIENVNFIVATVISIIICSERDKKRGTERECFDYCSCVLNVCESGLCHVRCACLAGQKNNLIKIFVLCFWREMARGFCSALPSLCVAVSFFFSLALVPEYLSIQQYSTHEYHGNKIDLDASYVGNTNVQAIHGLITSSMFNVSLTRGTNNLLFVFFSIIRLSLTYVGIAKTSIHFKAALVNTHSSHIMY